MKPRRFATAPMRLPFLLAVSVAFASSSLAQTGSYTWTTIAGKPGVSGTADGMNTNALFNRPTGLALGPDGCLYLAEQFGHRIRKMTPIGNDWWVSSVAGQPGVAGSADGMNSAALFNRPSSVAVDAAGNLFITDNYNQTIRKIRPAGPDWVVTTVAGQVGVAGFDDGINTNALFRSPQAVTIDTATNLYITDRVNNTVRKLEPMGEDWVSSTIAGMASIYVGFVDGLNEAAEFGFPWGITVDPGGVLYVADFGNNAIRRIEPIGVDWMTTTIAGFSGTVGTNDGPGSTAMFDSPNGITVDSYGILYVTDSYNNTIRKLLPTKTEWMVSTIGGLAKTNGTADGVGDAARFYRPWGIAVESSGRLFVADASNNTIRMGVPASAPKLQLSWASDQLVLTWPGALTNYVLETTATLDSGAAWTPLTNGITLSSGNYVLTNSTTAGTAFFRLRKE